MCDLEVIGVTSILKLIRSACVLVWYVTDSTEIVMVNHDTLHWVGYRYTYEHGGKKNDFPLFSSKKFPITKIKLTKHIHAHWRAGGVIVEGHPFTEATYPRGGADDLQG